MNRALSLRMFVLAVFVCLGLAGFARSALAEATFRCGSGLLVSVGDHMGEVQAKCGTADFVTQRLERRKSVSPIGEQIAEIVIDEWMYDFGPRAFIHYVTFENARVIKISSSGYGTKE